MLDEILKLIAFFSGTASYVEISSKARDQNVAICNVELVEMVVRLRCHNPVHRARDGEENSIPR